jgi:hypothetical protein
VFVSFSACSFYEVSENNNIILAIYVTAKFNDSNFGFWILNLDFSFLVIHLNQYEFSLGLY